jgi:flavin reductase (DIM6/NTAB) family NADH-FMN oxidoreductase RutF/DNA-binding GntR family transcriptional regulator
MSMPAVAAPHDLRRLTPEEFRDVIGSFATGVTVITALHEGKPHGTTASAVTSLSLEPPMILICLNETSSTGRAIAGAGRFAVNILGEDQAHEAMRFAKKGKDKFDGLAVASGGQCEPLLDGALSTLECRVVEQVTGGTHTVFLAEVDRASARAGAPLAYFRGQFGRLELAQDDSALRDIRTRVLSREIEVGVPLSLDDLAARMGLPRGAVYHALTKLSAEGLLSGADGAFVVTPLTLEAVDEAMQARWAIELGAAALSVGKVPADALDDLRRCLDATLPERHDLGAFDMGSYLPAYLAFHERVVALAQSPALVDAYRRVNAPAMIVSMTGARLAESGGDREAAETAFGHHRVLVEAYEAGDLEAVNRAIRVHVDFALGVTRRYMDAAGGRI